MARASAPTSTRSWCRPCSPATSSLPTISGPTRSPASNAPSRLPGPPSGTCHPIARTSIPSSSASRSSRPSFAPLAVAAPRRSGRSSVPVSSIAALTNAATLFGTAGTRSPHGHEKRFRRIENEQVCQRSESPERTRRAFRRSFNQSEDDRRSRHGSSPRFPWGTLFAFATGPWRCHLHRYTVARMAGLTRRVLATSA